MDTYYQVERTGGLAGLRAKGELSVDKLDPDDRSKLDSLLDEKKKLPKDSGADRYTYRVTRHGPQGSKTREIPESMIPPGVADAVQDEF